MTRAIGALTLLVDDYDHAIAWYTRVLGFTLYEDVPQGQDKRWVRVGPEAGTSLLLARAVTSLQVARIGDQTGGRVFLFLHTDDFFRDYRRYLRAGVVFQELPRVEPYGIVAVFADLYGNTWDLLQPCVAPGPSEPTL